MPPLPPVYKEKDRTEAQIAQKKAFVQAREEAARKACERAKKVLVESGFSEEVIHEFVQEKELSVAHHACRLADIKRVDAVVIQKQTSSRLEGFLKGDHTSALLHHCLVSPIWFVDDETDPSKAVVCLADNDPSLRALDHALFMLEETPTLIEIVHFSRKASRPLVSALDPLDPDPTRWLRTSGTATARFSPKRARRRSLPEWPRSGSTYPCSPAGESFPPKFFPMPIERGAGIVVPRPRRIRRHLGISQELHHQTDPHRLRHQPSGSTSKGPLPEVRPPAETNPVSPRARSHPGPLGRFFLPYATRRRA